MEIEDWKVKWTGWSFITFILLLSIYNSVTFMQDPPFFVGVVNGLFLALALWTFRKIRNLG